MDGNEYLYKYLVKVSRNNAEHYDSVEEFSLARLLHEDADAIEELLSEIEKYRHAACMIGEICVDASKQHITPEAALQKIRANIYYTRHE